MATKEELEKVKRRSAAYWKKRSKELEEASFNRGMRTYRDIEEAFDQAQRSIDKEIEKWYHRIAENNDLTLDGARKLLTANELEEFKWDVKEYIKAGKENAVNQSWMKELENASGRYHISRLEALKIETQQALELAFGNEVDAIDKMARRTIDEDYLKTCYELQKGIGVGWPVGTIDNRTLDKIVTKPWAADGANFSDRIWTNKTKMVDTLHQNLTRACILGQSPDKAIAALTQFVDKSISNAKRAAATLVQTEQAYFHAKAQQEAYTAIGVEEFEVVATLDSHTSEICQEIDGEHFPMSQYEIGTTVPPFHPRCRSVTAPYFEDDFGVSGQRAARGDDADATYYVPDNMTYKEWKKEQDNATFSHDEASKKRGNKYSKTTQINPEKCKGNGLKRRVDAITDSVQESQAVYSAAKEILKHRDKTFFEDLAYIDSDYNVLINKTYDYHDIKTGISRCIPSQKMKDMIRKNKEYTVISIHNHPQSTPPSLADIVTACKQRYKFGLIFDHDGTIYKYKVSKDAKIESRNDRGYIEMELDSLKRGVYNSRQREIDSSIKNLRDKGIEIEVFI